MRSVVPAAVWLAAVWLACSSAAAQVTVGSLLDEAADLGRLARVAEPAYTLVQFSSHDRRSQAPGQPGWFANNDGNGKEPIPGFAAVVREPDDAGTGEYLVCDVEAPGAIVRTWSGQMKGVLRVWIDDRKAPVYEGAADTFLARRTRAYLDRAQDPQSVLQTAKPGDALTQQHADYLPVPFAKRLRITWTGKLAERHFYHVQVRRYAAGTPVVAFDPETSLVRGAQQLKNAIVRLSNPGLLRPTGTKDIVRHVFEIAPGATWTQQLGEGRPKAIKVFNLRVSGPDVQRALRGTLLRITFDDADTPQVEAPVGDFFGAGPGVCPLQSLPMSVSRGGSMICRFVMPFREHARVQLVNHSGAPVKGRLVATLQTSPFDERTMYFRARWRADHGIDSGGRQKPVDVKYLEVRGQGRVVGAACMIVNPSGVPTSGGNWWGEGDEKIFVDGEATPAIFGTASDHYFNSAGGRPTLFTHAFCGQPLNSGPGNAGYVANYRHQILDDVPFRESMAFFMELITQQPTRGMSYARIVYHYARPGATDDHRALAAGDLVVPAMPEREPVAQGGARGAVFHHLEDLAPTVTKGACEVASMPLALRRRAVSWRAEKSGRLTAKFGVETAGRYALNMVVAIQPEGAVYSVQLDGKPLMMRGGRPKMWARQDQATQLRSVAYEVRELTAGEHELVLECVAPGTLCVDYIWLKPN